MPIGTTKLTEQILKEELGELSTYFDDLAIIASMPEFLAEGLAIDNLLKPDRVVIGTPNTTNG